MGLEAQTPGVQSQSDPLKDFQQRVEALDREIRAAQQKTSEDATKGAHVTADDAGFTIRSNDGDSFLQIGADLQIDNRTFLGPALTALPDSILLRRARPTFSGTVYKYFEYYFRPDFGLGTTVIYDAYVQVNYFSRFQLRAGKFKPGVGLERLQSDDDTSLVERSYVTLLVPSRDLGFQVGGDLIRRRLNYAIGVFNGVPDNGLSDAAGSDHREYAARVFVTPFQPEQNLLHGLGLGIAATAGSVDGIALPSYKSFGQNSFVTFASGVTSDGHRNRFSPQGYYYLGGFGLLAEYGVNHEDFQKGTVRHDVALRAWQATASYVLTGEHKGFGALAPRRKLDPRNHGWGAVEVAARTGQFSIDRGLYNYGFASQSTSARLAHEWVGGVNWYLNRMVRLSQDCGYTSFEGGGSGGGNRPSEKALITRLQINFHQTGIE